LSASYADDRSTLSHGREPAARSHPPLPGLNDSAEGIEAVARRELGGWAG